MTQRDDHRQRPTRLAAGAAAVLAAALATASLPAAGAAAAAHRGGSSGGAAAARGGTLRVWGANTDGQFGNGSTGGFSTTPVRASLPQGVKVTSVRAGCHHVLALTSKGKVLAWGSNRDGQLGDGTTTSSAVPVRVRLPAGTRVTAVRAGCLHSLALTSKGKVLAWGNNSQGQLGSGTSGGSTDHPVRVMLPAGTEVTAISAGFVHSLALTSDGEVLAWGGDSAGQLGDGRTGGFNATPVLVKVPDGVRVTAIAAADEGGLALTSRGKVLAWGNNGEGQLGDGTTGSSDTPVRAMLPPRTRVRNLVGGCDHGLALTTKGTVLAWGDNSAGQLGNGTNDSSLVPAPVHLPSGATVTAISAGCEHNLVRTAKGHVLAWGFNDGGELGNGTTARSNLPVRVQLPAGLAAIAIGTGPEADVSLAIVRKARP